MPQQITMKIRASSLSPFHSTQCLCSHLNTPVLILDIIGKSLKFDYVQRIIAQEIYSYFEMSFSSLKLSYFFLLFY